MAKQPDDKNPVGLDGFLSDDLAPAFWTPDLPIEESRWWPHVPFAFWLVAATKPRSLVELGPGAACPIPHFVRRRRGLEPNIAVSCRDRRLGGNCD